MYCVSHGSTLLSLNMFLTLLGQLFAMTQGYEALILCLRSNFILPQNHT